jgi:hypothetical protein
MALLKEQLSAAVQPRGAEHRKHHRTRALKGARIVFNDGSSVIDCTVRNSSAGGASLDVASLAGLPNEFDLVIGSETQPRHCRVAWKRTNRIGVQYVG